MPKNKMEGGLFGSAGGNQNMLSEITSEYPALAKYPWDLVEGDPSRNMGGGFLEFYSPDDRNNPSQGKATIELYQRALQLPRDERKQMVFGDMLHYLPEVDPEWNNLRNEYQGSLTDKQRKIDRMAYQRDVRNSIEQGMRPRSVDRFMDMNRLDAHVRGYLAPDRRNEWAGTYTPEQLNILERMRGTLGNK
tara:strand:- start:241 stop:813 length:573 start_codon:yes stop_codon:yes gene_type:complete